MSVNATIKFLGPVKGRPRLHGLSREKDNFPLVDHQVEIADARKFNTPLRLDEAGYTLVRADSLPVDKSDLAEVRAQNEQQVAKLLCAITGARTVVHFNSVIRRSERSPGYLKDGTTVPGRFAHSDFGAGEIEIKRWVDRILDPETRRQSHGKRVAMYNTWRLLTPPPTDVPLALCDVRTLGTDDRVGVECAEELPQSMDWIFEMSVFRFSGSQRWAYFPNMTDDEVIVFKGFDSDTSRATLTPHAAFTVSDCPEDAPARVSIESRFLSIF